MAISGAHGETLCAQCTDRSPVHEDPMDEWLVLCDVRATLDEFLSGSNSYAGGCMYSLRKMSRWGQAAGVPVMLGAGEP